MKRIIVLFQTIFIFLLTFSVANAQKKIPSNANMEESKFSDANKLKTSSGEIYVKDFKSTDKVELPAPINVSKGEKFQFSNASGFNFKMYQPKEFQKSINGDTFLGKDEFISPSKELEPVQKKNIKPDKMK